MESAARARLHDLTLQARDLLTSATADLLEGVYGLQRDGHFASPEKLPALAVLPEAGETRARLERLAAPPYPRPARRSVLAECAARLGKKICPT